MVQDAHPTKYKQLPLSSVILLLQTYQLTPLPSKSENINA
jgi:hypothetical protein